MSNREPLPGNANASKVRKSSGSAPKKIAGPGPFRGKETKTFPARHAPFAPAEKL